MIDQQTLRAIEAVPFGVQTVDTLLPDKGTGVKTVNFLRNVSNGSRVSCVSLDYDGLMDRYCCGSVSDSWYGGISRTVVHEVPVGEKIVFAVMSATQAAGVVDQLAALLQPHTVVVHHDFRKLAAYRPTASNVDLIPYPRDTGWGTWGFSDAIFYTLRHALDRYDFDYLQLLSPTCLPLRPLKDFEAHVATDPADVHADLMAVDRDDDTFMSFGYRTFAPYPSLSFSFLHRMRIWYFERGADFIQTHSLAMLQRQKQGARPPTLKEQAALWLTRQAALGRFGAHAFAPGFHPMIGGTFFGARRAVCEHLVGLWERNEIPAYLKRLVIVDETLFASLFGNSTFKLGRANHAISDFNRQGHPRWIELADLDRLIATGRFFGRKFSADPDDAVRRMHISRLGDPAR